MTDEESEGQDLRTQRDAAIEKIRHEESHRRRFIYSDVEALIDDGFLYLSVPMGDRIITFRSISGTDQIRLMARVMAIPSNDQVRRWIVASAIWMVDGYDVSGDKNAAYHLMQEWIADLRSDYIDVLITYVHSLNRRADRAVRLVEAFCYEPYGRSSWRMAGRRGSALDADVDSLVRRLWVAHNLAEDERLEDQRQWGHTRMQVGSMSSKGAQHLAQIEERIRDREEARRVRVVRDAISELAFGERAKDPVLQPVTVTVNGQTFDVVNVKTADTAEELEAEMMRFVRGEKDLHDVLVEEYFRGIRERTEARRAEHQRALEEARGMGIEVGVTGGMTELVGYTPDQLAALGVSTEIRTRQLPEHPETGGRPYETVIAGHIGVGWIGADLKPAPATPTVDVAPPTAAQTLQEKIERRRPALTGLSEPDPKR